MRKASKQCVVLQFPVNPEVEREATKVEQKKIKSRTLFMGETLHHHRGRGGSGRIALINSSEAFTYA